MTLMDKSAVKHNMLIMKHELYEEFSLEGISMLGNFGGKN
jgi:hypothetical protein